METTNQTIEKLFIVALRDNYRFGGSGKGNLTTEDLWKLNPEELDTIARSVNQELKSESEESFLKKKSTLNVKLSNKLEILKYIIMVKQDEAEAKLNNAKIRSEILRAEEALANVSDSKLNSMKEDELKAHISSLKSKLV
jgi:hypothetical protein